MAKVKNTSKPAITSIELPEIPDGFSRAKGGSLNLIRFDKLGDSVTGVITEIDTGMKGGRVILELEGGLTREVSYVANIRKKFVANEIVVGDTIFITLVANKNAKVFDILFQKNG